MKQQTLEPTEDEQALLDFYRQLSNLGFGKMEISVVNGQWETITGAINVKRKDLISGRLPFSIDILTNP